MPTSDDFPYWHEQVTRGLQPVLDEIGTALSDYINSPVCLFGRKCHDDYVVYGNPWGLSDDQRTGDSIIGKWDAHVECWARGGESEHWGDLQAATGELFDLRLTSNGGFRLIIAHRTSKNANGQYKDTTISAASVAQLVDVLRQSLQFIHPVIWVWNEDETKVWRRSPASLKAVHAQEQITLAATASEKRARALSLAAVIGLLVVLVAILVVIGWFILAIF